MEQIKTQKELRQAIAELERRKTIQELEIKSEFDQVKQALKPVNLVRNTFSRFAEIPEVRRTLISTVVGFGMGYVAKKAKDVLATLMALSISLTSCAAIGGIFKAGIWVGVIVVVVIIAIVLWLIGKAKK